MFSHTERRQRRRRVAAESRAAVARVSGSGERRVGIPRREAQARRDRFRSPGSYDVLSGTLSGPSIVGLRVLIDGGFARTTRGTK